MMVTKQNENNFVKYMPKTDILQEFDTSKPIDFDKLYVKQRIKSGKF